MKFSPRAKRAILALVVIAFVASAFAPMVAQAQPAQDGQGPGVSTLQSAQRLGVWLPQGVRTQLETPGGNRLTTALRICQDGRVHSSLSHVVAKPGFKPGMAISAVMQQEHAKAAMALDFNLHVQDLHGAANTQLQWAPGATVSSLEGAEDGVAALQALYPHLNAPCGPLAAGVEAHKQFARLADLFTTALPAQGKAHVLSTADAPLARETFEQLARQGLAVRDASFVTYVQGFEEGQGGSDEKLIWTSDAAEVTLSLTHKAGSWQVAATAISLPRRR